MLHDRVTVALAIVFLIAALYYVWAAAGTYSFSLAANQSYYGRSLYYNELATAFLHGRLWISAAPEGLLSLANPYDPTQNASYQLLYHDLTLYRGHFYLQWGPTPAVVLLVPLQLIGLGASSSLTVALFATVGLAFALGALRVLVRQLDAVPLWMVILAALVLVCCTTIPFELRRPAVYEEAIACGFCFLWAGVYLALRAIQRRRARLGLLALMSLCFGLAAGARPELVLGALLIVPVYLALRTRRTRRALLTALLAPVLACVLALLAYNAARFGDPLNVGANYQLSEETQLAGAHSGVPRSEALVGTIGRDLQFDKLGYLPANLWYYAIAPPRPTVLFPFLALPPPPLSYPLGYPSGYAPPEVTGGVLVMSPILLFALALPWLRRRRAQSLGALGAPLALIAVVGLLVLLFLSFQFYNTTERYETDFVGLLLFAALGAWFALSTGAPGWRRRTVRVLGAVLALWSCMTGLAIGFIGMEDLLQTGSPGTWSTLEDATSPLSTAIAMVAGHPILAEVQVPQLEQLSPLDYTTLGAGTESFALRPGTPAQLTIVSPDRRQSALLSKVTIGAVARGATLSVIVREPSGAEYGHPVVENGPLRIPLQLKRGLNRVTLSLATLSRGGAALETEPVLYFTSLELEGG